MVELEWMVQLEGDEWCLYCLECGDVVAVGDGARRPPQWFVDGVASLHEGECEVVRELRAVSGRYDG